MILCSTGAPAEKHFLARKATLLSICEILRQCDTERKYMISKELVLIVINHLLQILSLYLVRVFSLLELF